MHISKLPLVLFGLLLLAGCQEDLPTYSSFCEQGQTSFDCLNYIALDPKDKKRLKNAFKFKDSANCPYRVELIKYHVGNCNNPIVKSTGSDFDGYVRIEIKKGFKCYYKVQSDYKHNADAAFERVLKRVKIDINQ